MLKESMPTFAAWREMKLEAHKAAFPETAENWKEPPQRGISRTDPKPFSLNKLDAALLCCLYGKDRKGRKTYDLAWLVHSFHVDPDVTVGMVSVWRQESRFKKAVKELRGEFAGHYHQRRQSEMSLRDFDHFLREIRLYPVELKDLIPAVSVEDLPDKAQLLFECNANYLRTREKLDQQHPLGPQGEEWIAEQFDQGLKRAFSLILDPEATTEDNAFLAEYLRKQVRDLQVAGAKKKGRRKQ